MNTTHTTMLAIATLALAFGALQARADPSPLCSGSCTIDAASTGYTDPVTVVASGSAVTWHSTDVSHVQRETSTPLGSPASCFNASSGSSDSDPVTFAINGGVLEATTGSTTKTCANAVPVAGGFLLAYHCSIHANMNGVLFVKA